MVVRLRCLGCPAGHEVNWIRTSNHPTRHQDMDTAYLVLMAFPPTRVLSMPAALLRTRILKPYRTSTFAKTATTSPTKRSFVLSGSRAQRRPELHRRFPRAFPSSLLVLPGVGSRAPVAGSKSQERGRGRAIVWIAPTLATATVMAEDSAGVDVG